MNKISYLRCTLLKWYSLNNRQFVWRQKGISIHSQILSELLLQRTRAQMVEEQVSKLIQKYPTWQSIHEVDLLELQKDLRPLGLWKRRSDSLKALAHCMVDRNERFPLDRNKLMQLPAIGHYMANAILLILTNKPYPLLDVNMARVLERYFGLTRTKVDIRYDPALNECAEKVTDSKNSLRLNWAIMDFASLVCKLKPECSHCPTNKMCAFYSSHFK